MLHHKQNNHEVSLIFPHQLFENNPCLDLNRTVYLVEEFLFFRQYNFHKQKLVYHRATMKYYESYLRSKGYNVNYIESDTELNDVRKLIPFLSTSGTKEIHFCDACDDWLEKRIMSSCKMNGLSFISYESPMFINTKEEIQHYFKDKKRLFQTDFYIDQRKKRKILLDGENKPLGGQWTYDSENRLKYPKTKTPPKILTITPNHFDTEAVNYINHHFPENIGQSDTKYPSTYEEAEQWFKDFLDNRFHEFGLYEDAIVVSENILHHSVLTPMLNIGLLNPMTVVEKAIDHAEQHNIPVNSLEGFVRQILGWREFIRAVYVLKGKEERTKNFWNFTRKIPEGFYNSTTGILPLDITLTKVLNTAYNHHIERLMVLGNFMVLCEINPDEVYRWFMEMYIDAYDWVMVPNVYGMSQFADGGLMATKPYISGSNYLMKMSDIPKGQWQEVWDGLFWYFMGKHRSFFLKNPRLGMLIKTFDKMDAVKKQKHIERAQTYLDGLDNQ